MTCLQLTRIRHGLSLWALGYAVHIPPPRLSRIERGHVRPTPGERRRLAAVLGLEMRTLLAPVETPAQPWAKEVTP